MVDDNKYCATIGLEIHIQLNTLTKAFSEEAVDIDQDINKSSHPVSLGYPGALPMLNKAVLDKVLLFGLSIGAGISEKLVFDRKNYFYHDLPKGYQITQKRKPLCMGGRLVLPGLRRSIRITESHIEEDTAKSIRRDGNILLDYNRCGIPLMEVVTEPEIKDGDEAATFLKELRRLVRWLGISDGNMEDGSLRCDVNVSLGNAVSGEKGVKVEVKNINSIGNVKRAIDYEIERQKQLLTEGKPVEEDTRAFNAEDNTTVLMRKKHSVMEYRYIPEFDINPVSITVGMLEEIKSQMPPLPEVFFNSFTEKMGLGDEEALLLISSFDEARYFSDVVGNTIDPTKAAKHMSGLVRRWMNRESKSIQEFALSPQRFAQFIRYIDEKGIAQKSAINTLFEELLRYPDKGMDKIAEEKGLGGHAGDPEIKDAIKTVLEKYPGKVEEYKQGNAKLLNLFMGETMKLLKGRVDPGELREIIEREMGVR